MSGPLSVDELFELDQSRLDDLGRSEQLQCLMSRLLWRELIADIDQVVRHGRQVQQQWRSTNPNRSYLDEWDKLLGDPERLVELHSRYESSRSGLLSNSPLVGLIPDSDRERMLKLLREHRRHAMA